MSCTVSGTAGLPDGTLFHGAVFQFSRSPLTTFGYDGRVVLPVPFSVTAGAEGEVSFTALAGTYQVTEITRNIKFFLNVPEEATATFVDCVEAATVVPTPSAIQDVFDARDAAEAAAAVAGTVTDGDYGDVIVSGTGTVWTADPTTVMTLAGDQLVSGSKQFTAEVNLEGVTYATAGTSGFTLVDSVDIDKQVAFDLSNVSNLSLTTYVVPATAGTLALTTVVSSGAAGLAPASGGGTTNFLRADGTWTAPTATVADGDKGDVVVSGSGTAWALDYTAVNAVVAPTWTNISSKPTDLTTIAGLSPSNDDFLQRKAGAWANRTVAQVKTDLGLTGTNSGDQTITLTGNVTGSGTGSFATTIAAGAVTLAMQANMATASVVYRKTGGAGAPEVQTLATLKTDLGLTGTNSGDQTITLTGDVTGSGTGSFAATLATVNTNTGPWGSATQVAAFTVNGKGLITAAGNTTITPAWSSITSKPTTITGYGITDATRVFATVALLEADITANGAGYAVGTLLASGIYTYEKTSGGWIAHITSDEIIALVDTKLADADNVVDNARLANMAAGTIKGNNGTITADPEDLTIAEVTAMIDGDTPILTGDWKFIGTTRFKDSDSWFIDNADNSKRVRFEASGITTATDRVLTVQDTSGTIALTADLSAYQPLDADLTTIAGLTATTDSFMQAKGSAWAARTVAQVKTDLGLTGTNSGDQNLFSTIAVSGQSDVVADAAGDTLTLVAGSNITITTNAGTDTITIAASGGGSYVSPLWSQVA